MSKSVFKRINTIEELDDEIHRIAEGLSVAAIKIIKFRKAILANEEYFEKESTRMLNLLEQVRDMKYGKR